MVTDVKVDIVIPARYAAKRLPGKLLMRVAGKTILQYTWERACKCKRVGNVYIASGDWSVIEAAMAFGAKTLHTTQDHDSGSSRLAEAYRLIREKRRNGGSSGLIVNVQGDEPEMDPAAVDELIFRMQTIAEPLYVGTLAGPLEPGDAGKRSVVKVAVSGGRALYFSRGDLAGALRHIGVYCYRPEALHALREHVVAAGRSPLSKAEDLEQLYFLEHRWAMMAVECQGWPAGIDTVDNLDAFRRRIESSAGAPQ